VRLALSRVNGQTQVFLIKSTIQLSELYSGALLCLFTINTIFQAMSGNKILKDILILFVLAAVLFIAGNGLLALTNDNEVFYAQTAKEMIQHHSWMTPYLFDRPQFEKPIFIYWFLRLGFLLFGVSSFGARFFPAVFAVLGVVSLYCLGLIGFKDRSKAFLAAIILMTCGMYIGLAKTVFTDMFFSVLVMLSLVFFFFAYTRQAKTTGLLFASIFAGLAVLTKGPLGLLIPFLAVIAFLLLKKDLKFLYRRTTLWAFLFFLLTVLPWYLLMAYKYGSTFINEFILNDNLRRAVEAQHGGHDTWYYYPSLIISGMLPWSLFVLAALFSIYAALKQKENSFYIFLVCWAGSVFLIFQAAHSKVANYIFPIFPPLALLTASFIRDILSQIKYKFILYIILSVLSFFVLAIPLALFFSAKKYAMYINNPAGIHFLITGFLVLAGLILFCIYKKKLAAAIYLVGAVVPVFMCSLPLTRDNFERYISSKEACEYLLTNPSVGSIILCSKNFVRGVRYYTDKDVVVLDIGGKPLFSPHPILFLYSDEALKDFLSKRHMTYCVLKKSAVEDIQRINGGKNFKINLLKIIGNEYIIKVESLGV
jgi:4-amino-4-deoxy-L-arabinose transferase-like glycosyltransferase